MAVGPMTPEQWERYSLAKQQRNFRWLCRIARWLGFDLDSVTPDELRPEGAVDWYVWKEYGCSVWECGHKRKLPNNRNLLEKIGPLSREFAIDNMRRKNSD